MVYSRVCLAVIIKFRSLFMSCTNLLLRYYMKLPFYDAVTMLWTCGLKLRERERRSGVLHL